MTHYAICDFDGLVIGEGEFPSYTDALASCTSHGWVFEVVEGMNVVPGNQFFRNGSLYDLPVKPASYYSYDAATGSWADLRSPVQKRAALFAARSTTQQDKADLLLALTHAGILSVQEAVQAAQGQIPSTFESVLSTMSVEAQGLARIKWAGDQVINRMNPLLVLAAYVRDIGDEQLDEIFGVQVPV